MARILVVDQCEDTRESMGLILELCGHEVERAADATEALTRVDTFRPQAITTSVRLPGSIDGPALARTIRERGDLETVIICVTGASDPAVLRRALHSGCDQVLRKPVDADVLERAILDSIARAGARADG